MKNKTYYKIKKYTYLTLLLALAFVLLPSLTLKEKPENVISAEDSDQTAVSSVLGKLDISNLISNTYDNVLDILNIKDNENTKATLLPGSTAGSFSVNSGTAEYNIPITVTPGTGGMQPQLAINYNSGGGNAYLGSGFELGGLSAVIRGGANKTNNATIDGLDFDSNDKFYLDGQLLVCISGTYGANNAVYRTETDIFTKVISYGTAGSGPQRFKAWTKAGLIYEYAYTASSRVEAQGRTDVVKWAVNKISDTKGNYMTFTYYESNSTGESFITRIDYTGNTVTGLAPYCSVRLYYQYKPDPITKYYAGCKTTINRRLTRIQVCHETYQVRVYNLAYQNINNNTSQLIGVQECGMNSTCFKNTTFQWQEEQDGWISTPQYKPSTPFAYTHSGYPTGTNGGMRMIDLNGDGLMDMVRGLYWYGNFYYGAWLNTGNGWTSAPQYKPPAPFSYANSGYPTGADGGMRIVDLNGDGLPDMVRGLYWYGTSYYAAWLNTGNGWISAPQYKPSAPFAYTNSGYPTGANGGMRISDLNGDGLPDMVRGLYWYGTSYYAAWLNTGNGWISAPQYKPSAPFAYTNSGYPTGANGGMRIADLNGDGLPDMVRGLYWYGTSYYSAWLNTGNGWTSAPQYKPPAPFAYTNTNYKTGANGGMRIADFNGDGLPDMARGLYWYGTYYYAAWLNTGNGLISAPQYKPYSPFSYVNTKYPSGVDGGMRIADLNGDGLSDMIRGLHWYGINYYSAWLNTGSAWISAPQYKPSAPFTYTNSGYPTGADGGMRIVDINGDGLSDMVRGLYWYGNSYYGAWLNKNTNKKQIKKITNGYGKETVINYKYLTDKSVYTKGSGAVYPNMNVQPASNVVSSYSVSNGIGNFSVVNYKYNNLVNNLTGRGSLGFEQIEETDAVTGKKTNTLYLHDYHYSGMPTKIETRLSSGTLISKTENTYTKKLLGSGLNERWFTYINTAKQYKYKINGSLINTETNRYNRDSYANTIYSELENSNGNKTKIWNTYTDNLSKWYLGRLTYSRVIKSEPGGTSRSISVYFEYDAASGMLKKEITNSGNSNYQLVKEFVHDNYGNVTQSKLTGHRGWADNETRTTVTSYDSRGRFVTSLTNTLGHSETYIYSNLSGNVTSLTGPNGITSTYNYDGFGRPVKETRIDGNTTTTTYGFCPCSNAPANAEYFIKTKISGNPEEVVYYDCLSRAIRTQKTGFNGTLIFKDENYDNQGRVYRTSLPYYNGSNIWWKTITFDVLNRPLSITNPVTGTKTISYDGLTTTFKNELNQTRTEVKNNLGQIIKVTDELGNSVNYTYDPNGNMISVTDMNGNITNMYYDVNGKKSYINDPDAGVQQYYYNAFGELWRKRVNQGHTTVIYEYDKLGRKTKMIRSEETISYTYDTGTKGIGKIAEVSSTTGYLQTYVYDNYGRALSSSNNLPGGGTYNTSCTYDNYGRINTITYPSGFQVKNEYNSYNYLSKVKRASDNYTYFTANETNALGQTKKFTLGNGLQTERVYDNIGRVLYINTGNGSVQNLTYYYNNLSNITHRIDNKRSLKESFTFDVMDRIISSTVKNFSNTTLASLLMNYDETGNITYKSDIGCYNYTQTGNAGPHAVTSISGQGSYTYDINGNITQSPEYTASYTSFNKPEEIIKGDKKLMFDYGPDNGRYHQKVYTGSVLSKEIYYVGGIYEKIQTLSGIREKHYISAGNSVIAVYTSSTVSGTPDETVYLHKDHLGSVSEITDENGTIKESFSYDIWGKRRDAATWTSDDNFSLLPFYNRGFTNHEHLDEVGLIHMNGRVYDPVIARFLSTDPFVQDIFNSQNLNRYSYVFNSPLSHTDPTGFWSLRKAFKRVCKSVKKAVKRVGKAVKRALQNKYVGMVIQAVATIYGGPLGAAIAAATLTKVNGGSWGDALKAGGFAAVSSYTSGIIGGIKNVAVKVAAGGIFQGSIAEAQGGKFKHGFLSGVAGSIGGEISKDLSYCEAVAVGAVAGGTASKLGGGKFANGALSGAMAAAISIQKQGREADYIKRHQETFTKARNYLISMGEDPLQVDHQLYVRPADGPSASFLTLFMTEANVYAALIHDYRYGSLSSAMGFAQSNADLYTHSNSYASANNYSAVKSGYSAFWGKVMQIGTDVGGRSAWNSERSETAQQMGSYGGMTYM